jgi:hypothetical protein
MRQQKRRTSMLKIKQHRRCALTYLLVFLFLGMFFSLQGCRDDIGSAISEENNLTRPPSPGGSGLLSVVDLQATSLILVWSGASDDTTPSANLTYKVYYSLSDNISTYQSAIENGTLATGGWLVNVLYFKINPLEAGKKYWFNLFVKDADGAISAYTPIAVNMTAGQPPVPGANGALTPETLADGFKLSWTKASDDATPVANLQYRVFYAAQPDLLSDISLIEQYLLNGSVTELGLGWTLDIDKATMTALTAGTIYYFNVFVRDSDGFISAYTSTSNVSTANSSSP